MAKPSLATLLFRRRRYVIDRSLQMGVAAQVLTGIGGVALLCAAALYVFLGGTAVPGLDPLRQFLLIANATYFVLAAGILTLLTILITHRFAGPAYVIRLAIAGMLEGDYGRRLRLRKKDYLKPLAADFDTLRHHWVRHEEETRRLLGDLDAALDDEDLESAKVLARRLREGLLVKKAPDAPARRFTPAEAAGASGPAARREPASSASPASGCP